MNRPIYIVEAKRTAIGKAKKGIFAKTRPDTLLAEVIANVVNSSNINPKDIGDVIIGCSFPEAEQGQNVARVASLLAGLPNTVPGITINRYCSSGLSSIAIAANMINSNECEVAIAGGVESMSLIPMGGHDLSINPKVFEKDENIAIAYGMGTTAEKVAKLWQVSREAQDQFALSSHKKAIDAIQNGYFKDEIIPIEITSKIANEKNLTIKTQKTIFETDEGPRFDTSIELLTKLKPAFNITGSVTAGNSSQTSDGASCLVLVSEEYLEKHNLKPLGRFLSFAVTGVDPSIMGIGPISAIPKALANANLTLDQIDWIELNEAFAAQSIAVINDLNLDIAKINPLGGAIALGHPLGATGTILTTKLLHGLRRTNKRYGLVTMCIGIGMGAAGVFEAMLD